MKALTLWPEWAYAICHLGKRVENRGWTPTGASLPGGRLLIHAGKHVGGRPGAHARYEGQLAVAEMWEREHPGEKLSGGRFRAIGECPTSAIVAAVRVVDADSEQRTGWDVPGQWHWRLADVVVLPEPVPCRGAQGLWTVPEDVHERVLRGVLHG